MTEHIGILIVGDLNVHHSSWLRSITPTDTPGIQLHNFASTNGLTQCVSGTTRDINLLDLVLTDLDAFTQCEILPRISDHNMVLLRLDITVPSTTVLDREVWDFNHANWQSLRLAFANTNWIWIDNLCPDVATEQLTQFIL